MGGRRFGCGGVVWVAIGPARVGAPRSALAWCVPSSTVPSMALSGCLLGGAERPVRTVARDPGLGVRQEHPSTQRKTTPRLIDHLRGNTFGPRAHGFSARGHKSPGKGHALPVGGRFSRRAGKHSRASVLGFRPGGLCPHHFWPPLLATISQDFREIPRFFRFSGFFEILQFPGISGMPRSYKRFRRFPRFLGFFEISKISRAAPRAVPRAAPWLAPAIGV